ncbi:MAG: hypothetical protein HYY16_14170 [Planctomycetes bacterium]|nr:hypothetical protein [Planctomycetota bacterium]
MARWIPETAGVVLRKVDIVDWESDAAQQTIADFKIEGIPYTRVYDKAGRLLGEVRGADSEAVRALVQKGL